jgi:hypothetical protein
VVDAVVAKLVVIPPSPHAGRSALRFAFVARSTLLRGFHIGRS